MPLFISYSHQDRAFVDRLAKQLVAHNVNVWLDRWELSIGDSLIEKIQAAIEGASALLVILSKASVSSDWCKKELSGALLKELEEKRVFVLPVLLEECEIPLFVRGKLFADFRRNFDDGLNTILEGVAKVTNPYLARQKGADFHTDWATDWGIAEPLGTFMIRLTYVEQASDQPYSVLSTLEVFLSRDATIAYKAIEETQTGDHARLHVLKEVLAELEKVPDIRPRLNDQFEKRITKVVPGAGGPDSYLIQLSARRLGEETGRDILVNTTNLIRESVKHMEAVLHRPKR
jgi:hypothetical protein